MYSHVEYITDSLFTCDTQSVCVCVCVCTALGDCAALPTEKAAGALEVKDLYQKYSATIFYVFYSSFSSLEAAILDKGMLCLHHH